MSLTTDPNDPNLHLRGFGGQNLKYLVLSEEERKKGFVRPVRNTYLHSTCGTKTTMGTALSETYARDPKFYGATMCVHCQNHFPVGDNGEFTWIVNGVDSKIKVGT